MDNIKASHCNYRKGEGYCRRWYSSTAAPQHNSSAGFLVHSTSIAFIIILNYSFHNKIAVIVATMCSTLFLHEKGSSTWMYSCKIKGRCKRLPLAGVKCHRWYYCREQGQDRLESTNGSPHSRSPLITMISHPRTWSRLAGVSIAFTRINLFQLYLPRL